MRYQSDNTTSHMTSFSKIIWSALIIICFCYPLLVFGGPSEKGVDHIVAIIPSDSPPTYFQDKETKMPAGFAVDIMNEVASRAGLRVDYLFDNGWSDMIERIKTGEADVIPGMGVSPERKKELSYSVSIDAFPISFFVRREHPGITATMRVHTVGVIKGSLAYEYLRDRPDTRMALYESFEQGLFDLLAGKIDAFACPEPTFWHLAEQSGVQDRIKVVDKPIAETFRAIAVRKDNIVLLKRLNTAIEGFVGTAPYQNLYVKWYGKHDPYWTPRKIIEFGTALLLTLMISMALWRYRSVVKLNRDLSVAVQERLEATKIVQRKQERLESLLKISQYRAKNVQDLLDFALSEVINLTASKLGYIYHYDEARQEFTLNTWSRDVMKECSIVEPKTVYQLGKTGLWGEAVRQRRPIVVNDFQADNPLKRGYPEGHARLFSFLTVPVIREENVVAVVGVANKPAPYDDDDINQLSLLMAAVWRIVERNKAETALRESEEKFRNFIESANDAVFVHTLDDGGNPGCFIEVNDVACNRYGYTREEFMSLDPRVMSDLKAMSALPGTFEKLKKDGYAIFETVHSAKDGSFIPVEVSSRVVSLQGTLHVISLVRDITERKKADQEREQLISELQKALVEIKTLHKILPICSNCKRIRDDEGSWHQIEFYISKHTDSQFSHGLCAECAKTLYPGYYKE